MHKLCNENIMGYLPVKVLIQGLTRVDFDFPNLSWEPSMNNSLIYLGD